MKYFEHNFLVRLQSLCQFVFRVFVVCINCMSLLIVHDYSYNKFLNRKFLPVKLKEFSSSKGGTNLFRRCPSLLASVDSLVSGVARFR